MALSVRTVTIEHPSTRQGVVPEKATRSAACESSSSFGLISRCIAPMYTPPDYSPRGPCSRPAPFPAELGLKPSKSTLVPSVYYYNYRPHLIKSEGEIRAFVAQDLDFTRLNRIHQTLWLAGRKEAPARSLHRHELYGRRVLCSEQADLHMLWKRSCVFIKPCPSYLLSHDFWLQHMCADELLWADAAGFLLSYTWLVQRESDLRIAHREGLLPETMDWECWKDLAASVHQVLNTQHPDNINKRFRFGDLRLKRVNWLYRMRCYNRPSVLINGYHNEYQSYVNFLRDNTAPITLATIYLALVLQAFQVGLDASWLGESAMFQDAAAYFSLLSIFGPTVAIAVLVFIVVGYVFALNLLSEIHRHRGLASVAWKLPVRAGIERDDGVP